MNFHSENLTLKTFHVLHTCLEIEVLKPKYKFEGKIYFLVNSFV